MKIRTPYSEPIGATPEFLLIQDLGAVELDPSAVPAEWLLPLPEGREFAIFLSGANRPTYSEREAGELARFCVDLHRGLQRLYSKARAAGDTEVPPLPTYLAVMVCPNCQELQYAPKAETAAHYCYVCKPVVPCPAGTRHPVGASRKPCCSSRMQVLWTTKEEIPVAWHE